MPNLKWYFNRFKAMKPEEIIWRLKQKKLEKKEKKLFCDKRILVTDRIFSDVYSSLSANSDKSPIYFKNKETKNYSVDKPKDIFGIFPYDKYKRSWHSGFQTENEWEKVFSYGLNYKQRDDVGDARTNWELNRHFQFVLLAKNYYVTCDVKILNELIDLFDDWNNSNHFLMGISWTSTMEIAIRTNSWCFAYCFLLKSENVPADFLERLRVGILNMTDYISNHFSRFSSANNHLIVEASTVGIVGIIFSNDSWLKQSIEILSHEIPLQNYSDGVNKEVSLHYQSFFIEAVALFMLTMQKNDILIPDEWNCIFHNMCCYVKNCIGKHGEVVQFGDDDLGKIFDVSSTDYCHYDYALQLMSCLLGVRFSEFKDISENIFWLISPMTLEKAIQKPIIDSHNSICFKDGGVTLLRSEDEEVFIGIDHGPLGFGSIAAHAHADALSFQMFVKGKGVFIDVGTYIYHCYPEFRDYFRLTSSHNTVTVGGKNQSEMLGAFLWGKRAITKLDSVDLSTNNQIVNAFHNGYSPTIHTRKFDFDTKRKLKISDRLFGGSGDFTVTFALSPNAKDIVIEENELCFYVDDIKTQMIFESKDSPLDIKLISGKSSSSYGTIQDNKFIKISGILKTKCEINTKIIINF